MGPRREAGVAFLLSLVSAGLLLMCARGRWASGNGRRPVAGSFVHVTGQVTGGSVVPVLSAAILVAVAGAVAALAAKRAGRAVAGALMVIAGVAVMIESPGARGMARERLAAQLPMSASLHSSAWPWVAVFGGVLLALTGGLLAVKGPRWSALSSRYEAPAARASARQSKPTDLGTWDALDRGEDPTT